MQSDPTNAIEGSSETRTTSSSIHASNEDASMIISAAANTESTEHVVVLRPITDRPVYKLSVKLIETYKHINKVYYEAKAKRLREQADVARGGVYNDGYDDANYDYILSGDGEVFADRYILKHRVGKGSFGQVVCAYDKEAGCEVAIKIIKSRKPFLVQAQTEINLLTMMLEKDPHEEQNIVRLIHKFVYRNHQCLVFEMMSYNLYELLKNTRFKGISINLTRKFGVQLLRALQFLASPEVDIIHCDLKPENILLRHPRRSAIKIIDFGSSCLRTKRTYTYIQSRFYRSPEVLFGLPYDQKIDMWSLGCVLVEMHTGEPLFGGSTQADQICRLIDVLGMPPVSMLEASPPNVISQFFDVLTADSGVTPSPDCDMTCAVTSADGLTTYALKRPPKADRPGPRTLSEILGVYSGGPHGRRLGEAGHSTERYLEFLDFVQKVLVYSPEERLSATQALAHPYITFTVPSEPEPAAAGASAAGASSNDPAGAVESVKMTITSSSMEVSSGTSLAAQSGVAMDTSNGTAQVDDASTSECDSLQSSDLRGRTTAAQHRIRSKSAPSSSSVRTHANMSNGNSGAQSRNVRRQVSDGSYAGSNSNLSQIVPTSPSEDTQAVSGSGAGGGISPDTRMVLDK